MKSQISLEPHKPEAAESAPRSSAPVETLLHKIPNRYAALEFRVVLKYWSVWVALIEQSLGEHPRGRQGSAADPLLASSSPTNVAYWVLNDMHEWKSLLFSPTFPVWSSFCWVPNSLFSSLLSPEFLSIVKLLWFMQELLRKACVAARTLDVGQVTRCIPFFNLTNVWKRLLMRSFFLDLSPVWQHSYIWFKSRYSCMHFISALCRVWK